ncbi:hypothetical protein TNCV_4719302 [Trichonephila clavipes]|uniref:Uncharacterized protein n=1 Tax=Trichonephila clavipes TaxID=2585209 RepID=A0A8X6W5R1_TRICX|nr:hypothetical protein TNCV_4719302 [Trichonephila clavipes]
MEVTKDSSDVYVKQSTNLTHASFFTAAGGAGGGGANGADIDMPEVESQSAPYSLRLNSLTQHYPTKFYDI